jgi:hypothetical protein
MPEMDSFSDLMSYFCSDKLLRVDSCFLLQNERQSKNAERSEYLVSWVKVEHSGYGCMCGQHFSPKLDLTGNEIKAVMELTSEPGLKFDKQLKKIRLISFNDLSVSKTTDVTRDQLGIHIQTKTTFTVEPSKVCVLELNEKMEEPLKVFEEIFQKWKDQSNLG